MVLLRVLAVAAVSLLLCAPAQAGPLEDAAKHPVLLRGAYPQAGKQVRFIAYVSLQGESVRGVYLEPQLPFRGAFRQHAIKGRYAKGVFAFQYKPAKGPQVTCAARVTANKAVGIRQVGTARTQCVFLGLAQLKSYAQLSLWLTNRLAWLAYLSKRGKEVPGLLQALERSGNKSCFDTAALAHAGAGNTEKARALAAQAGPKTTEKVEQLLAGKSPLAVEAAARSFDASAGNLKAINERLWQAYLSSSKVADDDAKQMDLLCAGTDEQAHTFLVLWALRGPCPAYAWVKDTRRRSRLLLLQLGFTPTQVEALCAKLTDTPPVTTPKPPVTTPKPPVTTPKPPVTTPKPPQPAPTGPPQPLKPRPFVTAAEPWSYLFLETQRPAGWRASGKDAKYPRHLFGFVAEKYFALPTAADLGRLARQRPAGVKRPALPRPWVPAYTKHTPSPGDGAALQKARQQLASGWYTQRKQALATLAKLGAVGVPTLVGLLRSKHWETAIQTLGSLGPAATDAIPHLIPFLNKTGTLTKDYVAKALGTIGPRAIPALERAYGSSNPNVRAGALRSLGYMGAWSKPGLPLLIRGLRDRDPSVRIVAAKASARIGPTASPALAHLTAALSDAKPWVRAHAARALRRIDPRAVKDVVPAVALLLRDKHSGPQSEAALTLGALGSLAAPAIPDLVAAVQHVGYGPFKQVKHAFALIGAPAVSALLTALQREKRKYYRERFVDVLGTMGPGAAQAVPTLIRLLRDRERDVRQAAMTALKRIGAPAAGPLLGLLREQDPASPGASQALRGMGLSIGAYQHPVLVELHAVKVKDRRRALTNWLISRFRHEIAEKTLKTKRFTFKADAYREHRLERGETLGELGVQIKFAGVDVARFLDKKVTLTRPAIDTQRPAIVARFGAQAVNLLERKLIVVGQLFRGPFPLPFVKSMPLMPSYPSTKWEKLQLTFPRAAVAAKVGGKSRDLFLVLSVVEARTGELLAHRRVVFSLHDKPRSSFNELKNVTASSFGEPGRQGQTVRFDCRVLDQRARPIPGVEASLQKVVPNREHHFFPVLKLSIPPQALTRLGGKRRMVYLALTMRAGGAILDYDVVPLMFGPTPPVLAMLSGLIIDGEGCHVLIGTGLGGERGFWKLPPATRKTVFNNHVLMLRDLLALGSRARLQLPPLRAELTRQLIERKTWYYTNNWYAQGFSSDFSASGSREMKWTFHPDQTCEFASDHDFFANSTTKNTPTSAGAMYRPNLSSGAILGSVNVWSDESKQAKRAPFEVRGPQKGPYWIIRKLPSGTTRLHTYKPKARGSYGKYEYEARAIDGVIEGRYVSRNKVKIRSGPGRIRKD